jgi:hypothetical protein
MNRTRNYRKWLLGATMSRKIGASRKRHKIKQLQQIITAVRHQGKTKTVNFSMFFWTAVAKALARQG